jgi:uncharacterized protein YyaL (SSP411 family)
MAACASSFANRSMGAPEDHQASGPNHLIQEKSPYLLQHAYNPVDWYPWGSEAFAKARSENKPIFLSIGYSTCHWCHVMERESFTNPAIAQLLNENFICIKVDREERPDIDRVYMTFVEKLTGNGGWPMSVWLTPDLKPFFGGTYFPPEDRAGRPGLKSLLTLVAHQWKDEPGTYFKQADEVLATLTAGARSTNGVVALPVADLRERAFKQLRDSFDKDHGGFEQSPKFPLPARLEFLLDATTTLPDAARREAALRMTFKTLREMATGGIHDQLEGGFHRYSVDARWHVPHFEKMLYDQAQLASVYLSAWLISADPIFRDTARDTLRYVQQRMTDPKGGFYSAEDADSALSDNPGVRAEGAFYVWTAAEVERVLDLKQAALFEFAYGVKPSGNVAAGSSAEFAGQNILFRAHSVADCATKFALTEDAAGTALITAAATLLEVRGKRPRPARDDKIITAWNGLMISALAKAAQVYGEKKYAIAAERAAAFLEVHLFDHHTGRLARSYRAGVRDEQGFAEDYAFLVQGLLDLYEADFDVRWLEWAIQLQEKQIELFADGPAGGFFANTSDDKSVLLRLKEDNDAAEPSPNSISVRNLARLAEMLHRDDWRELALRTAQAFGPQLKRDPLAMPQMLVSASWLNGSPKQILIQGEASSESTAYLITEVWQRFLPRHVLVRIDSESRSFFEARVPFVAELPKMEDTNAIAYVCENFVCQLPTKEPAVLVKLLSRNASSGKR